MGEQLKRDQENLEEQLKRDQESLGERLKVYQRQNNYLLIQLIGIVIGGEFPLGSL